MTTKNSEATASSAAAPAAEATDKTKPLASRCITAAARIKRMVESASRSELATLRRLGRPGHPIPGAVAWDFIDRYSREDEHPVWMVALPLMTRIFHVRGSLGYGLYEARISPARVERWLRRDRTAALREARLLITRMEASGIPWGEAGELLHEWSDPQRKRVARDFFRAQRRAKRSGASTPNLPDS